jgi:hypothetical protein
MKHWLMSPHVQVDTDVLMQMRTFALSVTNPRLVADQAKSVVELIDDQVGSLCSVALPSRTEYSF